MPLYVVLGGRQWRFLGGAPPPSNQAGVSGSPEKAAKGDPSPDPLWDNEELN